MLYRDQACAKTLHEGAIAVRRVAAEIPLFNVATGRAVTPSTSKLTTVVTISAILSVAAVRSFSLQGSLRAWGGQPLRHREPQDPGGMRVEPAENLKVFLGWMGAGTALKA